ncbi:MAG: hypothetical protein WDO16_13460 [Bacteroidota bacterium]
MLASCVVLPAHTIVLPVIGSTEGTVLTVTSVDTVVVPACIGHA